MPVCGLSRIVIPAMLLGIVVSTFTQSELAGWAGAAAVGFVMVAIGRITGRDTSCTVAASTTAEPMSDTGEPVGR